MQLPLAYTTRLWLFLVTMRIANLDNLESIKKRIDDRSGFLMILLQYDYPGDRGKIAINLA
jgi:hypothetical protein